MLASSIVEWKAAHQDLVEELEAAYVGARLLWFFHPSLKERLGTEILVFQCPTEEQLSRWMKGMGKEEQRGASLRNLTVACMVFPQKKDDIRKRLLDQPGIVEKCSKEILDHSGVTLDPKDYEPCDAMVEWLDKNSKSTSKAAYFEPLDAWFVVKPPTGGEHDRFMAQADGKRGLISAAYDYVIGCLEHPKVDEFKVVFQKWPGIVIPLSDLIREAAGAYEDFEVGK